MQYGKVYFAHGRAPNISMTGCKFDKSAVYFCHLIATAPFLSVKSAIKALKCHATLPNKGKTLCASDNCKCQSRILMHT